MNINFKFISHIKNNICFFIKFILKLVINNIIKKYINLLEYIYNIKYIKYDINLDDENQLNTEQLLQIDFVKYDLKKYKNIILY